MATITNAEPATRLARAILADLRLYHEEMIRSGRLDPAVIDEGRELYRSRVDSSLHGEFERELAAFASTNRVEIPGGAAHAAPTSVDSAMRSRTVDERFRDLDPPPPVASTSSAWPGAIAIVLAILGLGIVVASNLLSR